MPSANTGSLRDRRRAALLTQIQHTAHQLFAERGFEAVTTEDIAAAAGISISTYFRYAPTKEGLLVDPVREAAAEIVGTYSARPAHESPVEALIQLFVTHANDVSEAGNLDTWREAVATAPHLLSKSVLVSESDHRKLIEQVANRMGVDAAVDIRPALLIHTSLATVKFVLDGWLTSDTAGSPPFHVRLEEALRITLAGFD
ncbi:regulator [Mycobacterium sp. 852002-53434_SCH5985345]|uniref:TetR family transcriptional regulator n=1 Tax=unclassified Mycobacterium TaxID=2642494 RepID=UPI0007FE933D|nr:MULTISPECIES: TetR family transcriptional regulator [unclassified Mycobacterium]OBF59963.1 regulator [Mycobacterium sp. 852002-53434_SCH5985345]OBF78261.1 regulator [Mycobacterium sp. 852002-51613_SCH5001154]OBF99352.1 regulator [Mycobacterium sp. 852014-52450_SCH5900713]